jgi:hypothetical protein
MFQGVGGGNPGRLGGNVFTLGGKFGTVLCNPRQGSCSGPNGRSLVLVNGDTPNGDAVDVATNPLPYLVNGDMELPANGDLPRCDGGGVNSELGWGCSKPGGRCDASDGGNGISWGRLAWTLGENRCDGGLNSSDLAAPPFASPLFCWWW